MTRSLTGDWTLDLWHSMQALYYRGGGIYYTNSNCKHGHMKHIQRNRNRKISNTLHSKYIMVLETKAQNCNLFSNNNDNVHVCIAILFQTIFQSYSWLKKIWICRHMVRIIKIILASSNTNNSGYICLIKVDSIWTPGCCILVLQTSAFHCFV